MAVPRPNQLPPPPAPRLVCATPTIRDLKPDRHRDEGILANLRSLVPIGANATEPDPVFNGRVSMLVPTFSWPGGSYQLPGPVSALILAYLQIVSPQAVRYVSKYATVNPTVFGAPRTPSAPLACAVAGGQKTYTDAQLEAWIDQVGPGWGIDPGDAAFVVNPYPNLKIANTDAPLSGGVGGYHSITPGGRVYCFINLSAASGVPITLGDVYQQYAQNASHELAECYNNPTAGPNNTEVCDPCASNCGDEASNFWALPGTWLAGGGIGGGPAAYDFYTAAVYDPAGGLPPPCPPADPLSACCYPPP